MSKHTHTAVHTIHRPGKDGKPEEIKAGSQFTPTDPAQAKYLEENGAARKNPKVEAEDTAPATGSTGSKKDGSKKDGSKKDDELL